MTDVPIDGVIEFPSHHEIMVSNDLWPEVERALRARDLMLTLAADLPGDHPVHLVEPAYQPGELVDAPGPYEALTVLTMLVLRLIDRELSEHESILTNPKWQARVNRAVDELSTLYQQIGEDCLHSAGTPALPLRVVKHGEDATDGQQSRTEDEDTSATPRGTFDPEANAAYVQIAPVATKVARTVEAIPGQVNVDYDSSGGIVGAEFLGVFLEPGGQWLITRVVPKPPAGDPHWNSTQFFGPHNQEQK